LVAVSLRLVGATCVYQILVFSQLNCLDKREGGRRIHN
jgi:hypothetical protein